MLCEKCKKLSFDDSPSAKAQGFVMGLPGKRPRHEFEGKWFPGESRKDLEDWCAKNCKQVKVVHNPPPKKTFTPTTEKVKIVGSNKNPISRNKKKD